MFQNILILCLGNICRSPIAHKLFEEEARAAGLTISVDSAGLTAMVGDPAHDFSKKVITGYGLSLHNHIAKQVTDEMVKAADLILVMDEQQRHMLERQFKHASGKTFRIGHFNGFDVPDPYGEDEAAFEKTYQLIDQAVAEWLKKLNA